MVRVRFCTYALAAAWLAAGPSAAGHADWWAVTADGSLVPKPGATPEAAQVCVLRQTPIGLELAADLPGLGLAAVQTPGGEFLRVDWPEAALLGAAGGPALPVARRLLLVPDGAAVRLSVSEGRATAIDLAALGYTQPVVPWQPSVPMPPGGGEPPPYVFDAAAYAVDESLPATRVTLVELGMVRGQRLWALEVRPVAYNPVRGTLTIWPHIEISIAFDGGSPFRGLGPLAPLNGVLLNPQQRGFFGRGSGNYLIITAQTFESAIASFVSAKAAQGYNVTTYTVAPGTSRAAIKSYIQGLWGGPNAPDYILIVGDTDGDPATSNTIPHWSGGGNRHANTDLPYTCMDGTDDWYPDIAIGRFAVRTVTQLQDVVEKTLYVAGGVYSDPDYILRATFIASPDYYSGDEETHEWVISHYMDPEGFTSMRVYYRDGARTEDVHEAFNTGCIYGVYYGHSWSNQWQGPIFTPTDVQNLVNANMYPIVLSLTCVVGDYASTTYEPCFLETWQRVADRGAVATIGATAEIYYSGNPGWPEISDLEKFFFAGVYDDGLREVSPVWQSALYRLLNKYGPSAPVTRDYFEMFNLLGDPALEIPAPQEPGFELAATPPVQDVCAPSPATYTVDVIQVAGFTDPVTLSAAGAPPGTSVYFSVNPVTPPGQSTMLVTNTAAAPPGDYFIQITGTAGSVQRTAVVELRLANADPGPVTLLSPPDGATDVVRAPTLSWQAASQAFEYDLEVATDVAFSNVVYSRTVVGAAHTLESELAGSTEYFWHVRARNGCGDSGFCAPFSFTTLQQRNYFTEHFSGGGFDLDGSKLVFAPDGSGHFYAACIEPITALPTDPAGGIPVTTGEDGFVAVENLPVPVWLYGTSYRTFYVCANGYVTFTGGDTDYTESLADHFRMPRVSALFNDFSPQVAGTLSWKPTVDRIAVTWQNVPEYNTSNSNTFQVELFYDGQVHISWFGVDATTGIAGLSDGNGLPGDFVESDLSATRACGPDCPGDFNGDATVGLADLSVLLAHYGMTSGAQYEDGDMDSDGDVDLADLSQFLALYGTDCD